VGTKIDLRGSPVTMDFKGYDTNLGSDPVTTTQGEEMAKQIAAYGYFEWYEFSDFLSNLFFNFWRKFCAHSTRRDDYI
jgi:hypothetical protein